MALAKYYADNLEKLGIQEGLNITQHVPNMNFFAIFGEASSPSISLRGISLVNYSDSWEAPVSIYIDDVYRGNPLKQAVISAQRIYPPVLVVALRLRLILPVFSIAW